MNIGCFCSTNALNLSKSAIINKNNGHIRFTEATKGIVSKCKKEEHSIATISPIASINKKISIGRTKSIHLYYLFANYCSLT
jgi:hypothetical protein